MVDGNPQLTVEQRLKELERKAQIHTDTIRILHNLIKETRAQIKDIILNGLKSPNA